MQRWITLTTDFGVQDWFVGTMKGVIASIAPEARIIDITHEISPGDITAAALALAASYNYFPPKTIHVAVVDPGVGGKRDALLIETERHYFIGPDNGIFTLVLRHEKKHRIRRLDNPCYFLPEVSRTFHGRDVFAPVAAHLSRGVKPSAMGTLKADCSQLSWPEAVRRGTRAEGAIIHFDRFGNAITNLPNTWLPGEMQLQIGRRTVPVCNCYSAVQPGRLVAVPGSAGYVEIAVNQGDARRQLHLRRGMKVRLVPQSM